MTMQDDLPQQGPPHSDSTQDVLSKTQLASSLPDDELRALEKADVTGSKKSRPTLSESERNLAGFMGLGIVVASIALLVWLGPKAAGWIEDRWNRSNAPSKAAEEQLHDLLKKRLVSEDTKPSRTLELEADRAEFEGRIDEATRLRQIANQRRSEEQDKAVKEKEFQEWRRNRYGEAQANPHESDSGNSR